MTQEEKELFKDLSARLAYQVKVNVNGGKEIWTLKGMFESEYAGLMLILEPSFPSKDAYPPTSNWPLSQCKPYLRSMSSMTKEEYNEVGDLLKAEDPSLNLDEVMATIEIDWLNSHHFDYRGLIDKGLAIEVTEENNPYKD